MEIFLTNLCSSLPTLNPKLTRDADHYAYFSGITVIYTFKDMTVLILSNSYNTYLMQCMLISTMLTILVNISIPPFKELNS